MLRAMTREEARCRSSGAVDKPLRVDEELFDRLRVATATFDRARPVLKGLRIICESVKNL